MKGVQALIKDSGTIPRWADTGLGQMSSPSAAMFPGSLDGGGFRAACLEEERLLEPTSATHGECRRRQPGTQHPQGSVGWKPGAAHRLEPSLTLAQQHTGTAGAAEHKGAAAGGWISPGALGTAAAVGPGCRAVLGVAKGQSTDSSSPQPSGAQP